ncbi:hypothetical protein DUI87_00268 [Hirundo rustica rustica]|uniref:G-protein coupled receptors family 1 profile domain-containing protein n=1 Tax=Hirundo rustica rustica TaxID=333673 RepID=A0A3M0LCH8_HIRRU|nr:hypothetical protein DUI87_00268 [Hirundo rustica rustica]
MGHWRPVQGQRRPVWDSGNQYGIRGHQYRTSMGTTDTSMGPVRALQPPVKDQPTWAAPGSSRPWRPSCFLLVVLGVPINALTVVCTVKYKKLRSHLNYILVNLAVANLLVVCVGSTTAFYSFSQMYFSLGPLACKVEGFTATLGGMVSLWSLAVVAMVTGCQFVTGVCPVPRHGCPCDPCRGGVTVWVSPMVSLCPLAMGHGWVLWSLAVVAFERFLVICKPLGNFTFRGSHAVLGCAITWIFGLIASVPPLFGWSRYIPEGLQCSCGPDWYTTENKWNNESYVIFLFCFCFGFPMTVIIFSYGRLLLTLRAVAKQQEQSATTQKAEREVTKMVVVMVLGFLASTVYNPVIYVFMNKQFRSCMLKLVFCGRSPFGDDDDVSGSSQATQVSSVSSSQVSPA